MKKNYIAPTIETVKIGYAQFLCGSVGIGDVISGDEEVTADSRSHNLFDDEDETDW